MITVKSTNIKKEGNKIISTGVELSEDVKRLLNIIESINVVWEGADALKYINVMRDKYIHGLEELSEVIRDYGMYLINIPEVYTLLDEIYASKNIDV